MIRQRKRVPQAPMGWKQKLPWYGPGILWMLSSVGTGSILFTPRVGSVYQYELFWLLLLVVLFMWVMITEAARYTTVTGTSLLEGMHTLPGPRNWAVWLLFVPQLLAASVGIAGLSAIVGSALALHLPGGASLYGVLTLVLCSLITTAGRYRQVERLSTAMAAVLMIMAVIAAAVVFPGVEPLAQGLRGHWPDAPNLYVIQPWVGTILAGSMGIIWFSYWTSTRGFAGGLRGPEKDAELEESVRAEQRKSEAQSHTRELRLYRLKAWFRLLSKGGWLGVLTGLVVLTAFLILGAELLAPQGILPQGTDVAGDLTTLFADVWGAPGRWLLLVAIVIALVGSVFANQDGWGRSFADMTLILVRGRRRAKKAGWAVDALAWLDARLPWPLFERLGLKKLFIVTITGIIPVIIILLFRDPVQVMSASGIIAAAHTPFIVLATLMVNLTRLPKPLQPGPVKVGLLSLAGLFYGYFAVIYFADALGLDAAALVGG